MPQVSTKAALDAQLVNSVIQATTDVLHTMTATDVSVQAVQASPDYKASGDISAVIGVSGENGEGMFALSFPLNLANLMVGRLIGIEPERVSSEDRSDGVGELVNMISGHAKASLSQVSGHSYKLALPTVIQGSDHEISSRPKNSPYLVVVFETDGASFSLQVSFKEY